MNAQKWNLDSDTGCWEWLLYRDSDGYGTCVGPYGGKMPAHRHAWEQKNGPIPEEMTIDHLCFNPGCVNPDHMRLLGSLDNAKNQRSANKTHCKNGHEYTPDNTYFRPRRKREGHRDCRACIRERVARYKARKSAA